jgi:glycerol uptake facilitator-like aquaporin
MDEEINSLSRRLLAEALGTAILVATVVGSGIMAERLADGNQAIGVRLCRTSLCNVSAV